MSKLRIPPHIGWPMAIIGLLGLSVTASLITVFAARSDGGAQVIDDYYHKAATWDSTRALQTASDALGWQVHLTTEAPTDTTRIVRLQIQNQQDEAVTGLEGTISAFRPQQAHMIDRAVLVETLPGVYEQKLAMSQPGLWDFEIDATRNRTPFLKRIRREVTQ